MSKKQRIESPQLRHETVTESPSQRRPSPDRRGIAVLDNPELRKKVDYENNVKIVNAYFEECIQHRSDGESFDDAKRGQDLEFYAHLYKDNPDKIPRDLATLARIKKGIDYPSFFARVVEMILWQAQKDYAIFGKDARVTPTSEFDDLTKGVDLALEIPFVKEHTEGGEYTTHVRRLGIDMTKRTAEDDTSQAALDAKSYLKFSRGQHERGYFRHGGVFRHLDYLHTPTFSGSEHGAPGLDLPVVVLSLNEQDLFEYCGIIIDPATKKPRKPRTVHQDPRFQEFRIKLFDSLKKNIEEQQSIVQKQEDIFRSHQRYRIHTQGAKEELAVFEKDIAHLKDIAKSMEDESVRGRRVADILEFGRRVLSPDEADVMLENTAAAVRSNAATLQGIIRRLQESLVPHLGEKIDTIAGQEKDKARKEMIQELLSGMPSLPEQQERQDTLFVPLHDSEYQANAMLIAGMRSEVTQRAKSGTDVRAANLVREIRTLKNTEAAVQGFERMFEDVSKSRQTRKSA